MKNISVLRDEDIQYIPQDLPENQQISFPS